MHLAKRDAVDNDSRGKLAVVGFAVLRLTAHLGDVAFDAVGGQFVC